MSFYPLTCLQQDFERQGRMMTTRFQYRFTLAMVLVVFLLSPVWAAFQVPPFQGYVTDQANVLSPEAEQKIAQIDEELKRKTTAQIAVLTVDTLDNTPVEQAALETARQWGVGGGEGNTGLL